MTTPVQEQFQAPVRFSTPTLLDKRSFTIMGLNAKPNKDDPIGYFGTGFKYAIAVLLRHNIPVSIVVQDHRDNTRIRYDFSTKEIVYRGHNTTMCQYSSMKHKDGKPTTKRKTKRELPFSTDLGKNWGLKEAYRELYSNTQDENGFVTIIEQPLDLDWSVQTTITVASDEFHNIHRNNHEIFLNENPITQGPTINVGHLDSAESSHTLKVEIYNEPSQFVYYRGIQVLDLNRYNDAHDRDENPLKSQFTYNLLNDWDLTEDRTLKHPYMFAYYMGQYILTLKNQQLIERLLTVSKSMWEWRIDFNHPTTTPSPEFMQTFQDVRGKTKYIGGAHTAYRHIEEAKAKVVKAKAKRSNAVLGITLREIIDNPKHEFASEELTVLTEIYDLLVPDEAD